jgi:histidinol-phosphate aminotransferase
VSLLKLDSNESPFGPSPRAVEAMRAAVAESHLYPDNDATDLRQKLAAKHGVAAQNIVVAAGLGELLDVISRVLGGPGLNAVTSERSFIVYGIVVKAAGGRLLEVPMRENTFDLDAIADAIDSGTRFVFLANPNNPTGTLVSAAAVDKFLDRIPPHVIVVLDEAYYDYAEFFAKQRGVEFSHSLDYVRGNRNVLALRTFSKAHGLAGVRVGYGVGPVDLVGRLNTMRTIYSVSGVAQAGALAALEDEEHVRRAVVNNAEQAEIVIRELSAVGFAVAPTWGNFIYCDLGEDAESFARRLQSEGVSVRPLGRWGAPKAIRVTIAKPEENQIFLEAVRKVIRTKR